jgi:hypothetical protein
MNNAEIHAFLKKEQHVYMEQRNASRKHREQMAAVKITHPELFDSW